MPSHRLVFLLSIIACRDPAPTTAPDRIILSRDRSLITDLELPLDNAREDGPLPEYWSISGTFGHVRTRDQISEFSIPLPANVLFYGATNTRVPPDMVLMDTSGHEWEFETRADDIGTVRTWSYARGEIFVRVAEGDSIPDFRVSFPLARTTEQRLNFERSGLAPMDFVSNAVPGRNGWREGVYLPAPGHIEFSVVVPENGKLSFRTQLLRPPMDRGIESDGATLIVEGERAGAELEFDRILLLPGDSNRVEIDLSRHEGADVLLRFRTETREGSDFDYVHIAEPTLYTPRVEPRRVLMLFIDTLRPDRMGIYGHDRSTTPVIDAIAGNGVVFDEARAPSSWTLPSGRSAISGMQPDHWQTGDHLGAFFAEAGWSNAAIVTNSYMTEAFGMAEGWGFHRSNMGRNAHQQVRRALAVVDDHEDRDLLLWLHLIDPHLPYTENEEFRSIWAGERPEQLEGTIDAESVDDAWDACDTDAERERLREYLWNRYDQNIRALDAALEPLFEAIGDDALVVIYSDHGEEFWEHGVMGHGHSLTEEQIRVPLIIRAPSLEPTRIDAPVNLIDIVPTVLELSAVPLPEGARARDGVSLVSAAEGEANALGNLHERPQAFGRILFGNDSWGVLSDGHKWVIQGLHEYLFHLEDDPTEDENLWTGDEAHTQPYLDSLALLLGRPVRRVWRADAYGEHVFIQPHHAQLWFTHPEEVRDVWTRWDPMSKRTGPTREEARVGLLRSDELRSSRELFIEPNGSLLGATLTLNIGDESWSDTVEEADLNRWSPGRPILTIGPRSRPAQLGWTIQPDPLETTSTELRADVEAALEAMGYLE